MDRDSEGVDFKRHWTHGWGQQQRSGAGGWEGEWEGGSSWKRKAVSRKLHSRENQTRNSQKKNKKHNNNNWEKLPCIFFILAIYTTQNMMWYRKMFVYMGTDVLCTGPIKKVSFVMAASILIAIAIQINLSIYINVLNSIKFCTHASGHIISPFTISRNEVPRGNLLR